MIARRAGLLAALVLSATTAPVHAQMFFASQPHAGLTVGPLFVRASVAPGRADATLDILFSLVVPPSLSPADLEQDLYVLWPGAVAADAALGAADAGLTRSVERLGLDSLAAGRVALVTRNLYATDDERRSEPVKGGAPFVTFVRQGGALGLTAPATWIRIPWTPRLVNRTWLVGVHFIAKDLVRPKPALWVERVFWGPRYRVSLAFHDVRSRAMFPLYFVNRDRVLRLSEDPSQLILNFAEAGHLKIDEMVPQSSQRSRSESLENTEVVSVFLDRSEGLTPQVLTAQFGYFSGLQAWAPVLIPIVFFGLGNLAGPLLRVLVPRMIRVIQAKVHFGPVAPEPPVRARGVVLAREQLARLVPGETAYAEVLRICGSEGEEHERSEAPNQKLLVYRGRRAVPHRRRTIGWLTTVDRWDVENHEVEITLDDGRVSDVHARVRRARLSSPEER